MMCARAMKELSAGLVKWRNMTYSKLVYPEMQNSHLLGCWQSKCFADVELQLPEGVACKVGEVPVQYIRRSAISGLI